MTKGACTTDWPKVKPRFWGVPVEKIDAVLFVGDAWAFIRPGTFRFDGAAYEWISFTLLEGTKVRGSYQHLVGVREMEDEE